MPQFLGAFAKLRKATISFAISIRLSASNNSAPTGQIFITFDISVFFNEFKFHKNLKRTAGTLHEDRSTFLKSYLVQFMLQQETVQTEVVEEIKTHIMCAINLFRKLCCLQDTVEKYCTAGQATDDNMINAAYLRLKIPRIRTLPVLLGFRHVRKTAKSN
jgi:hypothetical protein